MSAAPRRPRVVLLFLICSLLAACGSGDDGSAIGASTPTPPAPATAAPATVPVPPDTASTEATGTAGAGPIRTDIAYLTLNGIELTLDVYATDGGGDGFRPVVVAFHGLSSALKDSADTTAVAAAAAESGMVVFVPSWIAGDPFPLGLDDITMLHTAANCAIAFAQESARQYGGNPETTVAYGFSAGTGPALAAALNPADAALAGCASDATPDPVTGVVLGDGEYFWQSENFDGAFADDLDGMRGAVADFVDPTRWPADLSARFEIWAANDGTAPRPIGDASDEAGWLALRDPDGSIRSDLDRLDQLDDGVISYVDSAQLLDLRLTAAGQQSSLDLLPGGHSTLDKIPRLLDAIASAAGEA